MVSGFEVLGAIAASWSFVKDVISFCKQFHDGGTKIPEVLLRFENDSLLLGRLAQILTEESLESLDNESLDHLQRVFSYLLPIVQSTHTRLLKYKSNKKWDQAKWAIVGDDLSSAERALYEWTDRVQKCLVLVPSPMRSKLLVSVGESIPGMEPAVAQRRMEDQYQKLKEKTCFEDDHLIAELRLQDGYGDDMQPWAGGGRLMPLGSKTCLVEWKRLPAGDANDKAIKRSHEYEIAKLVSVLSIIDTAKMFSMRATGYFLSGAEQTAPFGIVYEVPSRYDAPVKLSQCLEETDNRGARVLAHSLDQRFELARQIASAIFFIHSIGWVHKGVQPSNVWLANRIGSAAKYPESLGTAFLAGFDYTRREDGRSTGDETRGVGWRRRLTAVDLNDSDRAAQEYVAEHDIYALGVVLVEIGRWKPLHAYQHLFEDVPAIERKRNLETMATGLKITMGRRYSNVTLRCLRILDDGIPSARHRPAICHILFDLEDMATATT